MFLSHQLPVRVEGVDHLTVVGYQLKFLDRAMHVIHSQIALGRLCRLGSLSANKFLGGQQSLCLLSKIPLDCFHRDSIFIQEILVGVEQQSLVSQRNIVLTFFLNIHILGLVGILASQFHQLLLADVGYLGICHQMTVGKTYHPFILS